MSFPTFDNVKSLRDPALSWTWTADILPPGSTGLVIPNYHVLATNLPFTGLENLPRFQQSQHIYFPGYVQENNLIVSFYETEDFFILKAFKQWRNLVVDEDFNYGLPAAYMGGIIIRNYDQQGNEQFNCQCKGVWPIKIDEWQLNYEHSGHLAVSIEFSTYRTIINFNGSTNLNRPFVDQGFV